RSTFERRGWLSEICCFICRKSINGLASHGERKQQQLTASGECSWGDGRNDGADIFEEGLLPCPEVRCKFDFSSGLPEPLDSCQLQEFTPLRETNVVGQGKKESGAGEPCSGTDKQAKTVSGLKDVSRSGNHADDCLTGQG
ncbi:hypothetical protein V5799_019508, partial [Amblyomma americanum]